ncbi:MAG: hypothetical protein R3F61_06475 [Myxococcota bacterium]
MLLLVGVAESARCHAHRALLTSEGLYCVSNLEEGFMVDVIDDKPPRRLQIPSGTVVDSDHARAPLVRRRTSDGQYAIFSLSGELVAGPAPVPIDSVPAVVYYPQPALAFVTSGRLVVQGATQAYVGPESLNAMAVRAEGSHLFWLASSSEEESQLMVSRFVGERWSTSQLAAGLRSVPTVRCVADHCSWIEQKGDRAIVVRWAGGNERTESRPSPVAVYPHGIALMVGETWVGLADMLEPQSGAEVVLWTAKSEVRVPGILRDAVVHDGEVCVMLASEEDEEGKREFWVRCVASLGAE